MATEEKIGRCDLCGLIDHHLIGGECPACHCRQAGGRSGANLRGRLVIETDTSGNKLIRLRPVGGAA
ncbi:MAG: hypothetical protein R8K47_05650 [Mariprofundaceae bacterium]